MIIAAGTSTATSALSAADALLLLAGGAVFGFPGWLAYAGKWRRWTTDSFQLPTRYLPFGVAWIGAGAMLAGLACLIAALGHIAAVIAYIVLGIPALVVFGCGLVFCIWTPRRFRPSWYQDSRSAARKRSH